MPMRITFDLEDKDLKYFRKVMKDARASAQSGSEAEILDKARASVTAARAAGLPAFVGQRIGRVERLVDMLADAEWQLDAKERTNVLSALAYFADPTDLIPDEVPVLGYIDDAIMIELVVRELKPELDAYEDFCSFRASSSNKSKENWLHDKRRQLHARMRRRRQSRTSRTSGGTRFRLF